LTPSLPLSLRYPRGVAVCLAASQLAVFSAAVADLLLVGDATVTFIDTNQLSVKEPRAGWRARETRVAGPGCAAVLPLNTVHSVKDLTDVRASVVDQPRRQSIAGIDL
jgi:hypothetical protein